MPQLHFPGPALLIIQRPLRVVACKHSLWTSPYSYTTIYPGVYTSFLELFIITGLLCADTVDSLCYHMQYNIWACPLCRLLKGNWHTGQTINLACMHFPKPRSIIKKGPALDGIPLKVYLVLGHFILQMIITFIENGFFHRDAGSAILTVLLKTNKYPSLCSNYRPL